RGTRLDIGASCRESRVLGNRGTGLCEDCSNLLTNPTANRYKCGPKRQTPCQLELGCYLVNPIKRTATSVSEEARSFRRTRDSEMNNARARLGDQPSSKSGTTITCWSACAIRCSAASGFLVCGTDRRRPRAQSALVRGIVQ